MLKFMQAERTAFRNVSASCGIVIESLPPTDAIMLVPSTPLHPNSLLHLVSRPPALSDNLRHLIHLALCPPERPESLLRQLACTLVLAVAQEFDDSALVGCKAVPNNHLSACCTGT